MTISISFANNFTVVTENLPRNDGQGICDRNHSYRNDREGFVLAALRV